MDEEELHYFQLYKVLQGPVKQAFIYCFFQCYTQDTDVHSYITKTKAELSNLFSAEELEALRKNKIISKHRLPTIFKVLKACCSPFYKYYDDQVWTTRDSMKDNTRPEMHLVQLLEIYKSMSSHSHRIDRDTFNTNITKIGKMLKDLMEGTRTLTKSPDKRDLHRITAMFDNAVQGKGAESSENDIFDDVSVELQIHHKKEGSDLDRLAEVNCDYVDIGLLSMRIVTEETTKKKHDYEDEIDEEMMLMPDQLFLNRNIIENAASPDIWVVEGEAFIGKSTYAYELIQRWCKRDIKFQNLHQFEAVLFMCPKDWRQKPIEGEINFLKTNLPLCCGIHGFQKMYRWLLKKRVLLIIDDAEQLCDTGISEYDKILSDFTNLSILIFTSDNSDPVIQHLSSNKTVTKMWLLGFNPERALILAERIFNDYDQQKNFTNYKKFIKNNLSRLWDLLKFPSFTLQMCSAYLDDAEVFKDVTTASEVLWAVLQAAISETIEQFGFQDSKNRVNVDKFVLEVCQKAHEAVSEGKILRNLKIDSLKEATWKAITIEASEFLLSHIFKARKDKKGDSSRKIFSGYYRLQQEFLAAWYSFNQLLCGKNLNNLVTQKMDVQRLVLFMAGHMHKMVTKLGGLSEDQASKLIKTLVNYSESSFDNLLFIFKLVTEFKCDDQLTTLIVEESEYPEEWKLSDTEIQLAPLEILMNKVSPTRLILDVSDSRQSPEILKVTSFLCRVKISIWLEGYKQLSYGYPKRMDRTLKTLLKDPQMPYIDHIAGFLSEDMLKQMYQHTVTKRMVYLKVKATDMKTLCTILLAHKYLPNLVWLEIVVDMDITKIDVNSLTRTTVPLMDVYFTKVHDKIIPKTCDIIAQMNKTYSGIHLDDTDLTPEGVFTVLKELNRREVCLEAPKEGIDKFRRWFYPELYDYPASTPLTDEEVTRILGNDDRKYYSDHKVVSSRFITELESHTLMSYLHERDSIRYFRYKAENVTLEKGIDGTIEIIPNSLLES
ncbi:uncharacterized protein LOC143026285 isoform X2 [Oratosquilla oratoria]